MCRVTTDAPVGGYDYYIFSPGPPLYDHVYYAHGICRRELAPADCNSCMEIAASHPVSDCSQSVVGVRIQLQDCRAMSESYPFQGIVVGLLGNQFSFFHA